MSPKMHSHIRIETGAEICGAGGATNRIVEVVIPGIDKTLYYHHDITSNFAAGIGSQVLVTVRNRTTTGYVVNIYDNMEQVPVEEKRFDPAKLKPVINGIEIFNSELLDIIKWLSTYYGCRLADALDTALPKYNFPTKIRTAATPVTSHVCLTPLGLAEHLSLSTPTGSTRSSLHRAPQQRKLLEFIANYEAGFAVSKHALKQEQSSVLSLQNLLDNNFKSATVKELANKQFISVVAGLNTPLDSGSATHTIDCRFNDTDNQIDQDNSFPLTAHQMLAHEAIGKGIDAHIFKPFLLFGVTGSGKTEVYIRLIQDALRAGRSALVIVPEISLTPQIVGRFKERLGVPIAVIHSLIGKQAKFSDWQNLLAGETRVAIGARSAIFAPLTNLGIIVVDEEHDGSYKQSDGVRYNARDLATIRARHSSCPVVLGSATPSLESLYNVQLQRYTLLEIPERATNVAMPSIEIVDMSRLRKKDMASPSISPQLYLALNGALENKEQAIILYNRRGFSSYLQCNTCHKSLSCPHCSVTLTYHQRSGRLICHYCAYCQEAINTCPICCNPKLSVYTPTEPKNDPSVAPKIKVSTDFAEINKPTSDLPRPDGQEDAPGTLIHCGGGTEKVEEEFQALFPRARIVRMDRDTVIKKDAHRKILEMMHNKEADILIGTQMIAKGHDIAGVSLVGIIDADVGINMPDFRASERSYQLLQQASGRAGRRDKTGRVVIQTRNPNHPAIVAISTGKQKAFLRYELDFRKELSYPPYTKMLRIIVSSKDLTVAKHSADKLGEALRTFVREMTCDVTSEKAGNVTAKTTCKQSKVSSIGDLPGARNTTKQEKYLQLLGPTPAPIEKLRDRYRHHFIIKSSSVRYINQITQALVETKSKLIGNSDLRISIDVDPIEML